MIETGSKRLRAEHDSHRSDEILIAKEQREAERLVNGDEFDVAIEEIRMRLESIDRFVKETKEWIDGVAKELKNR